MPLCRCSWLYQWTKRIAHCRAASRSAKPLSREFRPVLGGAEQRLGEGIVVAHPWPRVRRLDAEPVQHGQHRRGLQGRAVVTVQHRPHRHGMHALGERGAPGQMRGMIGAVGVMHLEADDLAAVEVEDQIKIEPTSLHLRRQERHIPAPDLAGRGGDVRASAGAESRGGRARPRRFIWPWARSTRWKLDFAGDVDTFIGQRRDDPRRRGLGEARLVGDCDDARPFGLAQCVRRSRTNRIWPTVALRKPSPVFQRCSVRGSMPARAQAGPAVHRRRGLARYQRIRVWRSSRRVIRPRRRGRPPRVFLTAQARRPFRPAPCPCGAVPAPAP